jgi:hypothetical protein
MIASGNAARTLASKAWSVWRSSNALVSHCRVDDFHQESRAIFDIAASCSGRRGVEHGVHELVEQIAVGRVDFHTVETGPPRIGEGLRKGRCFGVNPTLR